MLYLYAVLGLDQVGAAIVQKLPPAVKKGSEGSVLPRIISPHIHSRIGFPSESRSISPELLRLQTEFSVWMNHRKTMSHGIREIFILSKRMPTASIPVDFLTSSTILPTTSIPTTRLIQKIQDVNHKLSVFLKQAGACFPLLPSDLDASVLLRIPFCLIFFILHLLFEEEIVLFSGWLAIVMPLRGSFASYQCASIRVTLKCQFTLPPLEDLLRYERHARSVADFASENCSARLHLMSLL